MKNILLAILCVLSVTACTKKPSSDPYSKISGDWKVSEKGTITPSRDYIVSITKSTGDGAKFISITNFYDLFTLPITGYLTGDTLHIANQMHNGKVTFGLGKISSDNTTISMTYIVIDTASQNVDCFAYPDPPNTVGSPSVWTKL